MTKSEALGIVLQALENVSEELDPSERFKICETTPLFGSDSVIDSLSLVSMIVDVEQAASDAAGRPVSLTDDRALSQPVSPFRNPDTLSNYIVTLLQDRG